MIIHYPARLVSLVLGVCLLIALTGCGSNGGKADVSGTIKLRGQAPKIDGLQISFMDSDGVMVAAPISEGGTYKAAGVSTGEVKVCLVYVSPEIAAQATPSGPRLMKPGQKSDHAVKPATNKPAVKNPIPEPLRDFSTSKLTHKVEAGKDNTFDYDLP